MGFYFRKSVGFGPIRFNFSRSGIGVSAGVKGARISSGPRGTYVHAGRNGFYYRQRVHQPPSENRSSANEDRFVSPSQSVSNPFVIKTADVSALKEMSLTKLLDEINERAATTRIGPIAIGITVLGTLIVWIIALGVTTAVADMNDAQLPSGMAMFVAFVCSLAFAIIGSILSWSIHKGDELERTTPLFYELEPDAAAKFRTIQAACRALSLTSVAWRVHTNQPSWDWKRNAGASNLITRARVHFGMQNPPYIATNVDVWTMALNDLTLFFLPDYILVRQRKRYGAIAYGSFNVSFSPTRFIEDQGVPRDSQVVGSTWRYVNKKGGPDRRFSNNVQIPIVEYGFLLLQSSTGLNIHIHTSSVVAAKSFAEQISNLAANGQTNTGQRQQSRTRHGTSQSTYIDPKIRIAFETLGIETSATREEVIEAYRNMAKIYHPDKLTHLAPEFVQLAEERMKEMNIACDILKRYYGV